MITDNTIEPTVETSATADPAGTDDTNLNSEARNWRLKYRDAQNVAAEAIQQAATNVEVLRATQRQLVDQHIAARIVSTADFWGKTELAELLGDDGSLDLARAESALEEILAQNPHYRAPAPGTPLTAPASSARGGSGGDPKIGYPATSLLNPSPYTPTLGWADVLNSNRATQ